MKINIFSSFFLIAVLFSSCIKDRETAVFTKPVSQSSNSNSDTAFLEKTSIKKDTLFIDNTDTIRFTDIKCGTNNSKERSEIVANYIVNNVEEYRLIIAFPNNLDLSQQYYNIYSQLDPKSNDKGVYMYLKVNTSDKYTIYDVFEGEVKIGMTKTGSNNNIVYFVSFSNLVFKSSDGSKKTISSYFVCREVSYDPVEPKPIIILPPSPVDTPTTTPTPIDTPIITPPIVDTSVIDTPIVTPPVVDTPVVTPPVIDTPITIPPVKQIADIQITEFASEGTEEWVEIYNNSSFPVDLTDYFITQEGSSGLSTKYNLTGTIQPGEYAVIIDDSDASADFTARWPSFDVSKAIQVTSMFLSTGSTGDEIIIGTDLVTENQIIDQVSWTNDVSIHYGGTVPGTTSNITASKQTSGTFTSAIGTPGAANGTAITIPTEPIDPPVDPPTDPVDPPVVTPTPTQPGELDFKNLNESVSENFNGWKAKGFSANPGDGQLSSENWKIKLSSTKESSFGGEHTGSDFSDSGNPYTSGAGSSGLHAYQHEFDLPDDYFLGTKSSGTIMTPGYFEFRIKNNSGTTITSVDVSYLIRYMNSGNRSNSLNLSYSTNGSTFINVPSLDFATPASLNPGSFESTTKSTTISNISVAAGSYFYLRWDSDDSGNDKGDDFGLDNLTITPH